MDDLCFQPITALAEAIAAGELSPVALTDAYLARIEALEPRLNAYITVTADAARTAAKAAKDFAEADRIRDELATQGVELIDKPGGVTEWIRA